MRISSFFLVLTRPTPLHLEHSFSGILPLPRHVLQTPMRVNIPIAVLDVYLICPVPWHVLQVTILYPLATPCPEHSSQVPNESYSTVLVVPKSFLFIVNSKYRFSPFESSSSRGWRKPPKTSENISNKSSAPPVRPCEPPKKSQKFPP